ncbi:hypothetical protein AAU61_06615 [Desulfocarbo indianensis]|nr:hypothetical protein AAU61_06615 [Desulfocarbo indianensis]
MKLFLDIRTLSFITGATSLAMSFCMLHVALRRKTYPGFHLWTAAFLANSVGLALMSMRHLLPDLWSVVLSNGLLLLAAVFLGRGLASFSGARQITWLETALMGALMALLAYFTFQRYDVRVRTIVVAFGGAVIYLRAGALALGPVARVLGERNLMLAASFLGGSLWFMACCVTFWFFEGHIADFMDAGSMHGLTFVVYLICSTMFMVSLMSINGKRLENDLGSARREINSLRGILPICANCKKIRDDQGYWQQVEQYVSEHTGAEFTHGICPECMKKLYPELTPRG